MVAAKITLLAVPINILALHPTRIVVLEPDCAQKVWISALRPPLAKQDGSNVKPELVLLLRLNALLLLIVDTLKFDVATVLVLRILCFVQLFLPAHLTYQFVVGMEVASLMQWNALLHDNALQM
jgi:hypothetical protein